MTRSNNPRNSTWGWELGTAAVQKEITSKVELKMKVTRFVFVVIFVHGFSDIVNAGRRKRQSFGTFIPVGNGEVISGAFQVPIQTLTAVHDLLQATRGRVQAFHQAYQNQMAMNPQTQTPMNFNANKVKPFAHFFSGGGRAGKDIDKPIVNSKALVQPK